MSPARPAVPVVVGVDRGCIAPDLVGAGEGRLVGHDREAAGPQHRADDGEPVVGLVVDDAAGDAAPFTSHGRMNAERWRGTPASASRAARLRHDLAQAIGEVAPRRGRCAGLGNILLDPEPRRQICDDVPVCPDQRMDVPALDGVDPRQSLETPEGMRPPRGLEPSTPRAPRRRPG